MTAYLWVQTTVGLIAMINDARRVLSGLSRSDRAIALAVLAADTALVAWGIWLLVEVYRHA